MHRLFFKEKFSEQVGFLFFKATQTLWNSSTECACVNEIWIKYKEAGV